MPAPTFPTLPNLLPGNAPITIDPLPGDAGNRRYFRIHQDDTPYILMQMADPEGFKASEEATTGTSECSEIPFLNTQRHLAAIGLPVPHIIGTDLNHGLILLEDLGDTSLMAAIQADPSQAETLYTAAIDHLLTLQAAHLDGDCIATTRDYSPDLFMWEFDHYLEYGIEALHGEPIPAPVKTPLRQALQAIAERLGAMQKVPVHRDYHSRNIMLRDDGSLAIIDFQDALMGPASYDLASLLWDPYVTLPQDLCDRLIERYLAAAPSPSDDFRTLLSLTALQRLCKAAGRFVYIDRVKGNPGFLPDIPACLDRAADILANDPTLAELRTLLVALEPRLGQNSPSPSA